MKSIFLFCLLIFPLSIYAASNVKLDASCESARATKLAPERSKLITDCVAKGKSQSQCSSYYKTYGDASGNSGNYTQRKYNDLPECIAARGAPSQHRAGSDRANKSRDSDPKRTNYR